MFEQKPEIDRLVELVFQEYALMRRGDILGFDRIEKLIGFRPYQDGTCWGSLIKKLKRRMEDERNITLHSVPSVGYKLATIDEQKILIPNRGMRWAWRKLKKSGDSLKALHKSGELNDTEMNIVSRKIEGFDRQRRALKAERRTQEALLKKSSTNYVERIPTNRKETALAGT